MSVGGGVLLTHRLQDQLCIFPLQVTLVERLHNLLVCTDRLCCLLLFCDPLQLGIWTKTKQGVACLLFLGLFQEYIGYPASTRDHSVNSQYLGITFSSWTTRQKGYRSVRLR